MYRPPCAVLFILSLAAATPAGEQPLANPDDLVQALGDEDYTVREKAQQALLDSIKSNDAAKKAVEEGLKSQDPEVRMRSAAILKTLMPNVEANHTTTVANMISLVNAQSIFKRQRWYTNSGKGFSNGARDLHELASNPNKKPHLISRKLAEAFGHDAKQAASLDKKGKVAFHGYIFVDNSLQADGTTRVDGKDPIIPVSHISYCAYPADYPRTGKLTFVLEMSGTVYAKDTGGKPVRAFPMPLAGWEPAGD